MSASLLEPLSRTAVTANNLFDFYNYRHPTKADLTQ